jgi:hypothetical protein
VIMEACQQAGTAPMRAAAANNRGDAGKKVQPQTA